ncbi:kinase-like domain-containing protein [Syncephalastrum racemosum]|uniref:Kinase-like domain-containing protein n=1 Tax=Syncephalastrum racemosum TaxID=13706 RepID=A0A1X2HHR2_SYNRA|nr:kinase-like domain-containing protein [Syncephalastrum racemosum]
MLASTTMPIKAAAKARQKPHDDYPWIAPTPITRPGFQRPTRSNSGSYSIVSIPPPDPRTGSRVLRALTVNLLSTFERKDPEFLYSPEKRNPKRTLTKPCEPAKNDGYDNEDCDYILRVHDILGENDQQYRVVDLLGHGTFGQVVKCQHIRTGELMSVKVIKNKLAFRKQSKMEAEILKRLYRRVPRDQRHSLLTLHDTFDHKNHLCLVLELLSVNLYELLGQNGFKGLPLPLVRTISKQLLETLVLLRTAKVIHCDIKPENILLKEVDKPDIKLVDFGSACQESKQMYSYIQSRFYRSPEVILGMPYSYEIDVWSTGAVVAELYLGIPIFPGSSEYDQLRRITEMLGVPPHSMLRHARNTGRYFNQVTGDGKLPDHKLKSAQQYSQEQGTTELLGKKYFAHTGLESIILHHRASKRQSAQDTLSSEEQRRAIADFCKGLLQLDPRKRWTAAQALQHPFITGAPYTGAFDPFKCIFPEQEKQNAAMETKQKLSSGGSRSSASSNVDVSRKTKYMSSPLKIISVPHRRAS